MIQIVFLAIFAIALVVGVAIAVGSDVPDAQPVGFGIAVVSGVAFAILLVFSVVEVVPPGRVGIPVTFGSTGNAVGPGMHVVAPWTDIKEMDLRLQEMTFEAGSEEEGQGAISAQARGGGNLQVDVTFQYELEESSADELYATVGTDYREKLILPAIRTCVRDAAPSYTAEEAYTTKRDALGKEAEKCVVSDLDGRGIRTVDLKLRDVDPGETVKTAIDAKQKAEQDLQRRGVELSQAEIDAEIERIGAQATYDAERIIACGGVRVGEGEDVKIVPNYESCDQRQFTNAYLTWLYITTIQEMALNGNQTFAIVPPGQDLSALLNIQANAETE